MNREIFVFGIHFVTFLAGTIYHLKNRQQLLFTVRIRKRIIILLIIWPLVLGLMAYFLGNRSYNYLLVFMALLYAISSVISEDLYENGIFYRSTGGLLLYFAKWEEI